MDATVQQQVQYPGSCCIPAVCCMHKLWIVSHYFTYVACKMWLTLYILCVLSLLLFWCKCYMGPVCALVPVHAHDTFKFWLIDWLLYNLAMQLEPSLIVWRSAEKVSAPHAKQGRPSWQIKKREIKSCNWKSYYLLACWTILSKYTHRHW